ncbi:hypothetical protein SQW19_05520 [Stenotrophomonas acidaminiphila]|uniref:hypothetical protein n=1 Tax=Stenotrophomonas acidaminiphila TaxID=128780 RepID=UPI002ABD5D83|nr:hypothetical protein [Stenotrophomonas acidaminiphila]WPU57049.1 hypothetical protein SQW19_05520 [Stenotrophomonas acidaminiphila]
MAEEQEVGTGAKLVAKKSAVLSPLPLSIARSALFSVAPNGPSSKHRVIATAKKGVNATVTYTGPHLSMEHFRLWQALLFIAEERGQLGGEAFDVSLTEVLRCMGKEYKHKELKQKISNVLTELKAAVVTVISDRVCYQNDSLIDVGDLDLETRILTVKFGKRIATRLLDREILKNDIERSREFKRHYLAIWLHGFISSQASRADKKNTKHTFSVDELRRLCGTQVKERWHFCQDLGRALEKLKMPVDGIAPLVVSWKWDDERTKKNVIVEKVHTLVKLLEETKETAAAKDRRTAAGQAAASRARVAL